MPKKVLICGDSFAADWSVKYDVLGWPNMLAQRYEVCNLAQAGCGQYKIFKQLERQKLDRYDAIIISHTSPYRAHTAFHPVHHKDKLHHSSDFIYADVKAHDVTSMVEYFEKFFDLEYAEYVHTLICKDITSMVSGHAVIHMTHFDWNGLFAFDDLINFKKVHAQHPGNVNHYDPIGNSLVFEKLNERLVYLSH